MKIYTIMMTFSFLLGLWAMPAQAQDNTPAPNFSQAQLDALLAPIALYPDTLLSHILIASTYPLEVIQADRWARNNTQLSGDAAVNAAERQDWDPSIKALVAFPDVLKQMSEDLDWTQQLGDAFLASEARVMDSIQGLRNKAYAAGSLNKVEHVKVVREERVIYIEPAVERVVYVPVYDTRVVYGSWWWPESPPVYWHRPAAHAYVSSGFYWGPRVYVGSGFFFSGCHWRDRRVVVVERHHHHPRPIYNNRNLVHYRDSRQWQHNPVHRRGVAYYDNSTRERFNSQRESTQASRVYRTQYTQPGQEQRLSNGPNRAAPRSEQLGQRETLGQRDPLRQNDALRQGEQTRTNGTRPSLSDNRLQPGTLNPARTGQPDRAEQLRERITNNAQRTTAPAQSQPEPGNTWRGSDQRTSTTRDPALRNPQALQQQLQERRATPVAPPTNSNNIYRGNQTPTDNNQREFTRQQPLQTQPSQTRPSQTQQPQMRLQQSQERHSERVQPQRQERSFQREAPPQRQLSPGGGQDRAIRGGREL